MSGTKIQWCDESWNVVTGCTKISAGCKNCYAERMSKRLAGRYGYPKDDPFKVTFHPDKLDWPLRWRKPRKIFVCSMGDLFHDDTFLLNSPFDTGLNFSLGSYIAYTDYPMLDAIFAVMERSLNHIFILLTKRPENMSRYFSAVQKRKLEYADKFKNCPTEEMRNSPAAQDAKKSAINPIPNHIWIGVTAENQQAADERIPILLQIPAAVRFISVEPMLSEINLEMALEGFQPLNPDLSKKPSPIQWIIVGGESGPGARPMHPDWVRSIRDQCQEAGVPFFFKQWGEWTPQGSSGKWMPVKGKKGGINDLPGYRKSMWRCGKKKAGRILDGQLWDEMPKIDRGYNK